MNYYLVVTFIKLMLLEQGDRLAQSFKANVYQGSKGIRQWLINWFTSPMRYKIIPSVDYN